MVGEQRRAGGPLGFACIGATFDSVTRIPITPRLYCSTRGGGEGVANRASARRHRLTLTASRTAPLACQAAPATIAEWEVKVGSRTGKGRTAWDATAAVGMTGPSSASPAAVGGRVGPHGATSTVATPGPQGREVALANKGILKAEWVVMGAADRANHGGSFRRFSKVRLIELMAAC